MATPRISLIHATRGRPEQAAACRAQFLKAAAAPQSVEHLFVIDHDDPDSLEALTEFPHIVVQPQDGSGCVAAWNKGAESARAEILIQLSDDWEAPKNWDHEVINRIGDPQNETVLANGDGCRDDELLTMAILTRARYEQQGFMFFPGYFSMMSDHEFTHRAYRDKVVIEARDLVFRHLHPSVGEAEWDATYARQNDGRHYREGFRLFLQRNPEAMDAWPWSKRLRYRLRRLRERLGLVGTS